MMNTSPTVQGRSLPLTINRAWFLALGLMASALLSGCSAADGRGDQTFTPEEGGQSVTAETRALKGCKGKASAEIPSSGEYIITTFGNGKYDDGKMSCGQYTKHGSWYYAASRQRYGCGSHIRIEANGKCVIAETDDYGPDVCVEKAAGKPIIDVSPLVVKHLFGAPSAGYSDHLMVQVTEVETSTALGPCEATQPPPAAGGSGGGTGGSGSGGSGGTDNEGGGGNAEPGCGAVTFEGECKGDVLTWCDNTAVKTVNCASQNATCAWKEANGYYDCVEANTGAGGSDNTGGTGGSPGEGGAGGSDNTGGTPSSGGSGGTAEQSGCGSVTSVGECLGSTLQYCSSNTIVSVDCDSQGATCEFNSQAGYYDCIASEPSNDGGTGTDCGEVTAQGECVGDELQYCSGGTLVTVSCSDDGKSCGWNSDASYYDCL